MFDVNVTNAMKCVVNSQSYIFFERIFAKKFEIKNGDNFFLFKKDKCNIVFF